MEISIIIPAFNEEKRIGYTLNEVREFLDKRPWDYELLPVDDGSSDETLKVIEGIANDVDNIRVVRNEQNRGKGFSIRHGLHFASGRYIGFIDADYKTDIKTLDAVMKLLERGAECVIGDRTLDLTRIVEKPSIYRVAGSKIFRILIQNLMGLDGLNDTQCGFKFFCADAMRDIFSVQSVDGYMFDVEILLLARKMGYGIDKVPVEWTADHDSRFNPLFGMLKNLGELARIRWRH